MFCAMENDAPGNQVGKSPGRALGSERIEVGREDARMPAKSHTVVQKSVRRSMEKE